MTREEAIKVLKKELWGVDNYRYYLTERQADAVDMAIEALQEPEDITLTYDEKCVFLCAINRERQICRQLDEEGGAEIKLLVPIVDEIERKVKTVLWGENNG